jgi:2-amino-4-hydroxy-6-hydroxymethyldihydropteridine diphosphokinase
MILIAIGANLPDPDGTPPLETCRGAVWAIAALPGVVLEAVSNWYETSPVPPSGQPNYVNGVVRLARLAGALPESSPQSSPQSSLGPQSLLCSLQSIEARFGRRRAEANAARTLDLDLIDMDGLVRASPDPILPHPRAHLRAFVLLPLLDVAPDWVHPGNGRAGRDLLAEVGMEGVVMLSAPSGGAH